MPEPLPDQAAVRCNIAAYAQPRDVIISFRITRALADSIDNFSDMHHKKNRTEAIIDLLQIALHIVDAADRLEDPAVVKYLQENLYNVQLVDDIMQWPQDRIEAIIGALASERDRRIRLKIGNKTQP